MGINYLDIIKKMRWAGKLKNDSAVAKKLGVTPQALSNYKKRGEMPTDLVLRFAKLYGLSVDWLIHGVGEMYLPGTEAAEKGIRDYFPAAESPPSSGEQKTPGFTVDAVDAVINYVVDRVIKKINETAEKSGVNLKVAQ